MIIIEITEDNQLGNATVASIVTFFYFRAFRAGLPFAAGREFR